MSTKIEWCDESWNYVSGCDPVSEGCKNCFARRMAKRLAGRCGYPKAPHEFDVTVHPNRLELPLTWKKPRKVFVDSMFDFYHPKVKRVWRDQMQWIMQEACRHTYLILTKRPENIVSCFGEPNIWLGVTVESQAYEKRIRDLLAVTAAKHFVSVEPMLGPVNLTEYFDPCTKDCSKTMGKIFTGHWHRMGKPLDWVIAGPENGPGARECKDEWIYDLWQQCVEAGVPFFDKRDEYLERKWPT